MKKEEQVNLFALLDGLVKRSETVTKMEGSNDGKVAKLHVQIGLQGYTISLERNESYSCKGFAIFNLSSGEQVGGIYKSKRRAKTQAEKLDLAYGAYAYFVKEVR